MLAFLLFAFSLSRPAPAPKPLPYAARISSLETRRERLAGALASTPPRARAAVLDSARRVAFHGIVDDLIPAWIGTPWAYEGTTETPGEGSIACGYFVTTVLRDAGVRIPRAALAQQASERIVKTLAPPPAILRFRHASAADVIASVRKKEGDGLYVVGLDYHVGFLVLDGGRADFCHSAVLAPAHVVCEPAATSAGFESEYRVVGPAIPVEAWLAGRDLRPSN